MKNVITAAIFVAVTATSAFAGNKAQNLIDPVQVKIENLETQVAGLATVAVSLAQQLQEAKQNGGDANYILDLEEELEDAYEAYETLEEDYADEQQRLRELVWAARDERDALNVQVQNFEEQANAFITMAEETQSALEEEIESLNVELTDSFDEVAALEAELEEMTQDRNYQRTLKRENADTINELEAANEALEDELSEANDTIAAYDTAIEDIADIIDQGGDDVLDSVLSFIADLDITI